MTLQRASLAVPPDDGVWDDHADREFDQFLPVALSALLSTRSVGGLIDAVCAGLEEMVYDVAARVGEFDPERLAGVVYDDLDVEPDPDQVIETIGFRPDRVEVRTPLIHRGIKLAELIVSRSDGTWIYALERERIRRYAEQVAPVLYARLEIDELRSAALTDSLTGLGNRRSLDHALDRFSKTQRPLCLLLLDVDGLKEVNDALGYDQGDRLIVTLGAAISQTLKGDQVATRMGGDEFVVILPDASAEEARKRAKKIERAYFARSLPPAIRRFSQGISIGVVTAEPGEKPRHLIRRAARSMQSQKRRRRSDQPR